MSRASDFLTGGGESDPFANDGPQHAPEEAPPNAAAPTAASLVEGLTEDQARAVTTTEGPVLVLAAAGSGKTRVITRRIGYLVHNGIPPWQILALTFTNKAAGEMRERVNDLLAPGEDPQSNRSLRGLTVTTFHALCARLLRRYAELAELPGLKPDYTIYDTADQMALMKRIIKALDLSTTNWPPRSMLGAISNAKNELQDADAFERTAGDFASRTVAKVYHAYQKGLRAAGAVDFDDLLLLTATMLKDRPAIRAEIQQRYQYMMIDEYQDTNRAQFLIASLIAGTDAERGSAPNICVVGDPDQSIYGWRGADITNILDFETRYTGAQTIPLGQNFRSSAPILHIADTLIQHNKQRKHKPLFTTSQGGDEIEVVLCRDEHHEAEHVVDWFRAKHEHAAENGKEFAWKNCAIFYRTNALSRVIEEQLRRQGIPYVVARGTAFYQREEVKDVLAYLRVVANTADDVNLERVLNKPTRGIGKSSQQAAQAQAAAHGTPLFEALRHADQIQGITPRSQKAMKQFAETVDDWNGAGTFMGQGIAGSLAGLVERVIRESGIEGHYKKLAAKNEADADRLDNLDELISSAADFEQDYDPADDPLNFDIEVAQAGGEPDVPPLLQLLRAYLERVTLVADADAVDPDQGALTLMTLHAAKGLEFPAVAMIGLEENTLPHARAQMSETELEEERRLCFVGITRAMQNLIMTSARYRTVRGMHERTIPSRFLEEIGSEHVRVSDQADAMGGLDNTWTGQNDQRGFTNSGPVRELSSTAEVRRSHQGNRLASGLTQGTRVQHPRFGLGVIKTVTGGANARAQVEFKDVGTKTLVLEYAKLEIVP